MKTIISVFALMELTVASSALAFPSGGPPMSSEQRACLTSKLGKPGEGDRPSREALEAALKSCGMQPPAEFPKRPMPALSEEQQACMDSKVGQPGKSGVHPSRKIFELAIKECGVQLPAPPNFEGDTQVVFTELSQRYAAAPELEERSFIRSQIKELFYLTDDAGLKSEIRQFLKENPEVLSAPVEEEFVINGAGSR